VCACSICERQEKPSATISVSGAALRTFGRRARSAHAIEVDHGAGVGGDPDLVLHDRGQLLARLDARADFHAAPADAAGRLGHDAVVAELLFGVLHLGLQDLDLGLDHIARSFGGDDLGLVSDLARIPRRSREAVVQSSR